MAHLWCEGADGWGIWRLDAAGPIASAGAIRPSVGAPPVPFGGDGAQIIQARVGGTHVWALVAPRGADIRVNGRRVFAGLCVLADRDEIRTRGGALRYFSTELPAAVEAFPSPDRAVFCGRCRQQLEVGAPSVCCPGCGVWYNQSADLPCWTYSEKCGFCGHLTALDAGFTWVPEEYA
jgi:hypothetical protein